MDEEIKMRRSRWRLFTAEQELFILNRYYTHNKRDVEGTLNSDSFSSMGSSEEAKNQVKNKIQFLLDKKFTSREELRSEIEILKKIGMKDLSSAKRT